MSFYVCYKLFHKVAKQTTSLFRQVITTEVYKRIKQQTGKSTGPMGFCFKSYLKAVKTCGGNDNLILLFLFRLAFSGSKMMKYFSFVHKLHILLTGEKGLALSKIFQDIK